MWSLSGEVMVGIAAKRTKPQSNMALSIQRAFLQGAIPTGSGNASRQLELPHVLVGITRAVAACCLHAKVQTVAAGARTWHARLMPRE